MKKILWVGDGPDCPSGFGKATREIVTYLDHRQQGSYDVTVLGLSHRGDPGTVPYPVYTAAAGGDSFGVGRLIWMCDKVRPDVIVIQNDGWNIPFYVQQLRQRVAGGEYLLPEHAAVPIVAIVAVDGKNFDGAWLEGVAHAIFWTQFALDEAREGGYKGPASIVSLGVDRTIYRPMDRDQTRWKKFVGGAEPLLDMFIVGNVNRNQPRKRWDLLVRYFAKWINEKGVRDAYLYLHTAPTGDTGTDVVKLARYYGVVDRLALVTPEVFYGYTEAEMAETYNCFDVNASTTQGEGFGLTTLESMACGVPQILPDWSGLGDWAKGSALMVPCPTTHIGPPYVNVIGGIAEEEAFVAALDKAYSDKEARRVLSNAAVLRAGEPRFEWPVIGRAYQEVLAGLLAPARASELPAQASQLPSGFRKAYTPDSEPAQQQKVGA